ncbi:hypothetical protein HIM_03652 [Hirsutella minnesotensis 3608]|uniref:37S ribosomal protein MRP4 n=1 Tax=Hirsutella minnesotensis 3608 TaxID=1043627 RepID=A0A0F7ZQ78_9HYPO|nr:hypothetical protein HIM_03652 [Hirsutella minnesotensis 3608]
MIIRRAAVRQGRRTLATPLPLPSAIRRLSSEVKTEAKADGSATMTESPWKVPESARVVQQFPISSKKKKQKALQDMIVSLGSEPVRDHQGASWARPHQVGNQLMSPAQQYAEFQRIKAATRKLGSHVEKRYVPSHLFDKPPMPEDVTLEMLMAAQTHMGHNTSSWNPANSKYIYGVRQGIHIIALETTAAHLRRAARVVEEVAYRGGLILFVGTRKGQMEIVTKAAKLAKGCHLFGKWTPGSITNRDVILKTRRTKVVDHLDQELGDFDIYTGRARPLLPDLVVCLNPLENYTLLYECGLKNIPTIGVIDTNADPSWVTYTIPANDDSLRSVAVIGGALARAAQRGKKRRLEIAVKGASSWPTPPDIKQHMQKEIAAAMTKKKEVMGKMQASVQGFTEEEQNILNKHYGAETAEVGEDKMLELLGEAAEAGDVVEAQEPLGAGEAMTIEPASAAEGEAPGKADERLEQVAAQLDSIKEHMGHIEAAVGSKGEKN